jgi:hypothetical protein
VLVLGGEERTFPLVAAIAAMIEGLIAFHVISISSGRFRIDLILPAIMLIAGAVCWSRAGGKSATSAATVITLVATMQVVFALGVMH